jgi:hypothetical protein
MALDEIKKMSKAELLALARDNRLRVTSQMTKAELIDAIVAASKKRREPIAPKAPAKIEEKDKTQEEKRVEAARKAAKRVVAGMRERPHARRKARGKTGVGGPPVSTARPAPGRPPAEEAKSPRARPAPEAPRMAPPRPTVEALPPPPAQERTPAESPPSATAAAKGARARREKAAARVPRKPEGRAAADETGKASEEAIRHSAEEGKYYLGAEQRVMPPIEAIEIPAGYNVDRIVAMVRDPYWILTYWEVTDRKYGELKRHFADAWQKCKMILRVYDRTDKKPTSFDITLAHGARNWYINVTAERRYQVAIGALSPDGVFEQVAISNVVETPSDRVSDRIDEHWMVPDDVFKRIFAASGGHSMHAASAELGGLLEKRLLEEISSGAVTSFGSGAWPRPEKGRAFRFWIATELILYGGTEPDARVTVQGKEVKLRADGTFSLRFALPDGKIDLPVTAASSDGVEERTIETNVRKKSDKKEPVLK